MITIRLGALFALLLFFFTPVLVLSAEPEEEIFYLSEQGLLVKLEVGQLAEVEHIVAGKFPWDVKSCSGKVYFSDFASDEVYRYDPSSKSLDKTTIDTSPSVLQIDLVSVPESAKKSPVQIAFEKFHKSKVKPVFTEVDEPLAVAAHNNRSGLTAIACNNTHLFVSATLQGRVDAISTTVGEMARVASLNVGERPLGVALNPRGDILAISTAANDLVYLVNVSSVGNFVKRSEVPVINGPTELVWLDDDILGVLNRGSLSLSLIDARSNSLIKTIKFGGPINYVAAEPSSRQFIVLNGTDRKIYLVNGTTFEYSEIIIDEELAYPSFVAPLGKDVLIISSERDGRVIVFDTANKLVTKRIKTNFPARKFVKVDSSQ